MKYENVISETDAKGGQVCLAFDHNEDQLQLFPKMAAAPVAGDRLCIFNQAC